MRSGLLHEGVVPFWGPGLGVTHLPVVVLGAAGHPFVHVLVVLTPLGRAMLGLSLVRGAQPVPVGLDGDVDQHAGSGACEKQPVILAKKYLLRSSEGPKQLKPRYY